MKIKYIMYKVQDYDSGVLLTTPITQLNVRVSMLLTCDFIWLPVVVSSQIQFGIAINIYFRHKYRALYTQIVQ